MRLEYWRIKGKSMKEKDVQRFTELVRNTRSVREEYRIMAQMTTGSTELPTTFGDPHRAKKPKATKSKTSVAAGSYVEDPDAEKEERVQNAELTAVFVASHPQASKRPPFNPFLPSSSSFGMHVVHAREEFLRRNQRDMTPEEQSAFKKRYLDLAARLEQQGVEPSLVDVFQIL
jgi:hypothetical protein